jgi:TonB family protein
MKFIFLFLILATNVVGQATLPRVDSEEATKHFLKGAPPIYPQLAADTRISGAVLLEISVAPSGKTHFLRVISGHPLLVTPAVTAVKGWQFRPFLVDGKPATVVTAVMVGFNTSESQNPPARAELLFQYNFWTAENLARATLAKGDLVGAEEQVKKMQGLLGTDGDSRIHPTERGQLLIDNGALHQAPAKTGEIRAINPGNIPRLEALGISGAILAFTFGVLPFTGILFGAVPL